MKRRDIMNISQIQILFPGGKTKAVTMSYDDGVTQDAKLIGIFDHYGIKGTFNINSGFIGQQDTMVRKGKVIDHKHTNREKIKGLYKNHEVAVHALTHPFLEKLPKEMVTYQVLEDRKNIEEIVGYPVRGMAYPYGTYSQNVLDALKSCNIEYSRTTKSSYGFELPEKFLEWSPTCHHTDDKVFDLANKFIESDEKKLELLYIWGHSYEFDIDDNWQMMDNLCKLIGKRTEIWYATNIEIVDYLKASKSLKYSTTGSSIYNPTAKDIWMSINGNVYNIGSDKTISF